MWRGAVPITQVFVLFCFFAAEHSNPHGRNGFLSLEPLPRPPSHTHTDPLTRFPHCGQSHLFMNACQWCCSPYGEGATVKIIKCFHGWTVRLLAISPELKTTLYIFFWMFNFTENLNDGRPTAVNNTNEELHVIRFHRWHHKNMSDWTNLTFSAPHRVTWEHTCLRGHRELTFLFFFRLIFKRELTSHFSRCLRICPWDDRWQQITVGGRRLL